MLKSKEVSTCLIIVKLYSCVYRTSADRTVAINCHKCLDTLFAERCMFTWHESNVFACCNETTGAYENASRPTFVRPISVSHLGTIVSSRSQCYFSLISSNCTVIPYSIFPHLHFPTLLTRTLIFHTCVFHPRVAIPEFSVLVFSTRTHFATLYFSFPYLLFPVLAISAPPFDMFSSVQFSKNISIAQLSRMSHCAPEATLNPILLLKFTPETVVRNVFVAQVCWQAVPDT